MRLRSARMAILTLAVAVPVAAGAANDFSPESVFGLPAHRDIDDRCQAARNYVDRASKTTADIDMAAAIGGARDLLGCYQLPRLAPDEDALRFLYLAAATSFYVAGTKAHGDDALALFRRSDAMARELGAQASDHTVVIEHVEENRTLVNPAPAGPGKESYYVKRDVQGTAHPGSYTNVANELVKAIDAVQISGAASGTPSAQPAASSRR